MPEGIGELRIYEGSANHILIRIKGAFCCKPGNQRGLRHNYKVAYSQGIDNILMPMDTDSFRPGIDTRLLLEEINGYLLSCYWQMFSSGELAPDFLEKDILKRTGQWRMVYLKERNH